MACDSNALFCLRRKDIVADTIPILSPDVSYPAKHSIQLARFINISEYIMSILWVCVRILAGHFSRKPSSEDRCSKCKVLPFANFAITQTFCTKKTGLQEVTFQIAQSGSAHNPSQSSYSRDLTEPNAPATPSCMLVRYLVAYNNKPSLLSQSYISIWQSYWSEARMRAG